MGSLSYSCFAPRQISCCFVRIGIAEQKRSSASQDTGEGNLHLDRRHTCRRDSRRRERTWPTHAPAFRDMKSTYSAVGRDIDPMTRHRLTRTILTGGLEVSVSTNGRWQSMNARLRTSLATCLGAAACLAATASGSTAADEFPKR